MTIGERIRNLRIKNNLTQKELSELCCKISERKISESTIRKYELGILKNPKQDTLQIIASALGVSEYELQGISAQEITNSLSATTSFYNYLYSLGYEIAESNYNDKWVIHVKDTSQDVYISDEELKNLQAATKETIDLRLFKYLHDKKHDQ
ncbi:MAG: helix-turn-helix transcriptional regulator [Eubacteriales bacterium]|nr:helix-turn-helix transcriptional regulator [Eubacteriales bacterium]